MEGGKERVRERRVGAKLQNVLFAQYLIVQMHGWPPKRGATPFKVALPGEESGKNQGGWFRKRKDMFPGLRVLDPGWAGLP